MTCYGATESEGEIVNFPGLLGIHSSKMEYLRLFLKDIVFTFSNSAVKPLRVIGGEKPYFFFA